MSTTPAQSVAKILWRYVAYSFQSDGIPNAEIAFRYAAYTYSILDILEAHELALTVRYLFAETFAAADNRATDDPLVKNLQAVVNRTIAALWEGSYQAQTQQGAYSILSEKANILGPQEANTFQVTEADTSCFLRDVQHLRYEVNKLLSQPVEVPPPVTATQPERPVKNPGEPHILCKIAKIISCFIVAFSLPFPIWSGVLFLVLFWKKPKTIYVGWIIALLYVYSAFPWQVFAVYLAIVALVLILNTAGKRLSARPPRQPKPAKEITPAVVAAILVIGLSLSAVLTVWMQQKEAAPQPTQASPSASQPEKVAISQPSKITTIKAPEGKIECPVNVMNIESNPPKYSYYVFTTTDSKIPVAAYLAEDESDIKTVLPQGDYDLYLATGPKWYGVNYITGPDGRYIKCPDVLSLQEPLKVTAAIIIPSGSDAIPITADDFPKVEIVNELAPKTTQPKDNSVYIPITPPETGTVIQYPKTKMCAPLSIHTSGEGYYFFVLSEPGQHTRSMCFFAKAGEDLEIQAPLGQYTLYYAQGKNWYGAAALFGPETVYSKCDQVLNFREEEDGYAGFELTLYPVYNGNMETEAIEASEFPT